MFSGASETLKVQFVSLSIQHIFIKYLLCMVLGAWVCQGEKNGVRKDKENVILL